MDYLKQFIKYNNLSERRLKQLKLEEEFDQKLKECNCPQIVNEYFLSQRELHRKVTGKLYDVAFYELPEAYKRQMDIYDKIIPQVSDNKDMCGEILPKKIKLILDIKKKI